MTDQNPSIDDEKFWQREPERAMLEEMGKLAPLFSLVSQGALVYSRLLAAGNSSAWRGATSRPVSLLGCL